MKLIKIFDTTLRDGEQSPGCSMETAEKLEVAKQLCRLGVDVIEAGFAASSHGDFEGVRQVASFVKGRAVASLARCLKADIDKAYEALKGAETPRIHVFIATSPVHMEYKLKLTKDQVLDRIRESVSYAKSLVDDVQFSAEDATRSERDFLCLALETAIEAGATVVNVPDTVGYATPEEIGSMIRHIKANVKGIENVTLACHCHDDLGLATANSLAAVEAGADQVECTVNGIGERAGNASLEEIAMALRVRGDAIGARTGINTAQIYRASRLIYNITGDHVPRNKPVVGKNAFAHEAGIHQHGIMENRATYEIMSPEDIGISRDNMALGKHSGRHAFEARLTELGYEFTEDRITKYFERFKRLADRKKEVTDRDIEAIVANRISDAPRYTLDRFVVHAGNLATPTCVVTLMKDGEKLEDVALGDGPIDAAYNAIDKIVAPPRHELYDYSIHSVSSGKDALGEVLVRLRYDGGTVTGRGLSTDIIESSILAYLNAVNRLLNHNSGG